MSDLGVAIEDGVVDVKGQLAAVLKGLGLDVMGDKSLLLDGNRSEQQPVGMLQQILDKLEAITNGSTPSRAPVKIKSRTVKGLIWLAHPAVPSKTKSKPKSDGKQKSGYDRAEFDDNMSGVDRDCCMSARIVKDEIITIGFDNYGDLIRYIIRILDFSNENPASGKTLDASQMLVAAKHSVNFRNVFFTSSDDYNIDLTTYQAHTWLTLYGGSTEASVTNALSNKRNGAPIAEDTFSRHFEPAHQCYQYDDRIAEHLSKYASVASTKSIQQHPQVGHVKFHPHAYITENDVAVTTGSITNLSVSTVAGSISNRYTQQIGRELSGKIDMELQIMDAHKYTMHQ